MIRFALSLVLFLVLAESVFAMDQLTLINGQMVEGTIVKDVPGRHIDIKLINGQTKRYRHSDIASIDRDVPSDAAPAAGGSENSAWFSVLLGGYLNLTTMNNAATLGVNSGSPMLFDFGVKFGLIASDLDFAKLAFALSYDYVFDPNSNNNSFFYVSRSYHDLNVQALFTRLGKSGFYFGPTLGFAIFPQQNQLGISTMNQNRATSLFQAGAVAGYEFLVSEGLSIGPDLRFQSILSDSALFRANVLKFSAQMNLYF